MTATDRHWNSPTRAITQRYLLALGIVACLSIGAFAVLQWVIVAQETSAAIVNVSGRQRMLSQRTTLYAMQLVANPGEQAALRATLDRDLNLMERSHRALINGDTALGLPGYPSQAIKSMYFGTQSQTDAMVRQHIADLRGLLAMDASELPNQTDMVNTIAATATGPLLDRLDALVNQYQAESEADIRLLQTIETGVLITTLLTLLLEGTLIFSPAVARIVAERLKLVDAEAHTRLILDNSHDAILMITNNEIIEANPAANRLWRCGHLQHLVGREWLHLFCAPDESLDGFDDPPHLISQGIRTLTIKADDGSRIAADVSFSTTPAGGELGIIVNVRQSTEQLVRIATKLQEQNRELDQFASVTAHDLRAPLRAISNLTTWIEEDLGDHVDEGSRHHLNLLRNRVGRLEQLIDGIHRYARIDRTKHDAESINLDELVNEVFDEQQGDTQMRLRMIDPLPTITDDRTRVWQIFSNIIGNAIRHHDTGSGTINVTCHDNGSNLEFRVSDDGPGIPDEHHERVFEIFKTLKPKDETGSIGLGLALVRKIVKDRSGSIWIESNDRQGTTVAWTWPTATEADS